MTPDTHPCGIAEDDLARIRAIFDGPLRFTPSASPRPTLGERLVMFFRMNGEALSFWFAMCAGGFALAVVVGAYAGVGRTAALAYAWSKVLS